MQKVSVFVIALLFTLAPPSIFAQETLAAEAETEANQLRISGNEAPSYVAAEHFFRQAKNLHKQSAGWAYPTPSPWEVHFLEPLGIKTGSSLEAALKSAVDRADVILANEFVAEILQTSSKEAFKTSQLAAANYRALSLGEVYVDLLRSFEAEGVSKSKLVSYIHREIRPDFSGAATPGPGESQASIRKQLESMYQGFDQTVISSFSNLDPVEVLP